MKHASVSPGQLQLSLSLTHSADRGNQVMAGRLPSPEEIREIYEIRILLETEALRLGLRHHSADTLSLAERYLNGFELETDPMRLGYLDREFHAALYAPANRKRLFALINSLRTVSNQNYYREMSTSAHLRQCRIAHREIFENCRQRKLREATRALRCHLLEVGSLVAEAAARFNTQAN